MSIRAKQCPECGTDMIRDDDGLDVERNRGYVCPKCDHREPAPLFDLE